MKQTENIRKAEEQMAKKLREIDETERERKHEQRRQYRHDKRELKRVLLGHTHQNEEGRLTADQGPVAINRFGVEDGAVQVYFLGIMLSRKTYRSQLSREDFLAVSDSAMANIGRRVILEKNDGLPAVFRRFKLSVPVLLYLEETEVDGEYAAVAVTAKALTGFRSMHAIRRAFEKEMGERLIDVAKESKKRRKGDDRI